MNSPLHKLIETLENRLKSTDDTEKALAITDRLLEAYDRLPGEEKLWGLEEAADYLGIQPDTLRKWTSMKKIPYIPVGSLRRFDPASLKKWAIQNMIKPHRAWSK